MQEGKNATDVAWMQCALAEQVLHGHACVHMTSLPMPPVLGVQHHAHFGCTESGFMSDR